MANQIHNCGMTMDEIFDEEEYTGAGITGGNPTDEEANEAFDKLFKESKEAYNKLFEEVWNK